LGFLILRFLLGRHYQGDALPTEPYQQAVENKLFL